MKMLRKKMLLVSVLLSITWIVGMWVFKTTLEGYLHLFLLLAVNSALFCLVYRDRSQAEAEESQSAGTLTEPEGQPLVSQP